MDSKLPKIFNWKAFLVGICALWLVAVFLFEHYTPDIFYDVLTRAFSHDGLISDRAGAFWKTGIFPFLFAFVILLVGQSPPTGKNIATFVIIVSGHLALYRWYEVRFGIKEDGLFEWLTVAAAGLGAVLMLLASRRHGSIFLVGGLGLAVFALEEISWGQRVLGLASPRLVEVYNYQNETNLHNFLNPLLLPIYISLNFLAVMFLRAFLSIPKLSGLYRLSGSSVLLRLSDRHDLWLFPVFWVFASIYPGGEFVEEQWALFGLALGLLAWGEQSTTSPPRP